MKKRMLVGAVSLAGLAGLVLSAQDKYTAKVPGGLALSEFKLIFYTMMSEVVRFQ